MVLVCGDDPSKRAGGGEKASVCGDDKAATGSEGSPDFEICACLLHQKVLYGEVTFKC